jgi:hypothetical protein
VLRTVTHAPTNKEGLPMIITRKLLTVFATGIAVLAVGVPAASASTSAPATQVIKLTTVDTSRTNPTPTSFALTETLWQGKKQIGNDAIQCAFASLTATIGHCAGVLWFDQTGAMFITFAVTSSNTVHGRIVGGTGAYANARGTVMHTSSTTNPNLGWATLKFTLAP